MARAGEASATSVCGTDRANRPLAGEGLADDAGQKARRSRVGPAWAHADGHQPDRPPAQESLACVVGQQVLPDNLLRAIAGLRIRQRLIIDDGGQRVLGGVSEHGQGAGVNHHRAAVQCPAGSQQRLGSLQIRPYAEIEVGLAFPADRSGEVEDEVGSGEREPTGAAGCQQLRHVPLERGYPGVRGQAGRRGCLVQERDLP